MSISKLSVFWSLESNTDLGFTVVSFLYLFSIPLNFHVLEMEIHWKYLLRNERTQEQDAYRRNVLLKMFWPIPAVFM